MIKIISNRREYGKTALLEKDILNDPFKQFEAWLQEAIETVPRDVNAMVLATVDERGEPDTRVVLLKEFDSNGLIFFTHYNSPKGMQLEKNKIVALNFYWAELSRQVRVKGRVEKVSKKESETYFASRPRESQIATLASNQSEILSNRDDLYKKISELTEKYQGQPIPCPAQWGGYRVIPFEFEFFQGRDNRLNDRIRYQFVNNQWEIKRLSP